MLVPIRCIGCLGPIDDVSGLFKDECEKLAAKSKKPEEKQSSVKPDKGVPNPDIDAEEILENLGLIEYCCRKTLITAMRFSDHY